MTRDKRAALRLIEQHKHNMGPWASYGFDCVVARCEKCGASAVQHRAGPESGTVTGKALTSDCEGCR